jgi:hypothetical protein
VEVAGERATGLVPAVRTAGMNPAGRYWWTWKWIRLTLAVIPKGCPMRPALVLISVLAFCCGSGHAAATIARWEIRPFFPRRGLQKVPPPQYYATTAEMPAGAQVRIKVVQCPKNASLDLRDFIGGPVFSRGIVKAFADLAVGQVLTCKLDKKTKIAITTKVGDEAGTCKELERKEGYDVLKYSFGDLGELVIEVEVVGP